MHLRDLASEHPFPKQVTIRLRDLWRDPDVASIPVRQKHVDELREQFQPHLVGYPIVSRRSDGSIVILNGSHRCEALRAMFGPNLELDVSLYDGLTREQEVAIFERHHKKYLPTEERKGGADPDGPYIWSFDIDDTITAAPRQLTRLANALQKSGDKIVCVTGHGPKDTREHLLDSLGFPYDEIIIVDPGPTGAGKAKALKHLGAFMHIDDHVEFGPEIIKVCPVAFMYVEPPGDDHPKKDAKAAAKALVGKRSRLEVDRYHEERKLNPYANADDEGDWA